MLCPSPLLSYPKGPPWQVNWEGVPPGVTTMTPVISGSPKTSEHWTRITSQPPPGGKGPPWQLKRAGDPPRVKTMVPVTTSLVRFSRKSEVPRESTVLGDASDEQRTPQGSAEGVGSAVLVCDGDHAVQGAHLFYAEQPSWDQPALS